MNLETSQRKWPNSALVLALWGSVALLTGCAFALTGLTGIFAVLALSLLIVFTAVAAKFPVPVMGVSIWILGLIPFQWGLQAGGAPKLYYEGIPLLFYLAAFPLLYLFTSRTWQRGFGGLYFVLALFLFLQALSLIEVTEINPIRNFVESVGIGALLLILFLQEGANSDATEVGDYIVGITVIIAALSIFERIVQSNPIMENSNSGYANATLVRLTEGVYRPFVSFFNPSEAGTFMAVGVPFAVRSWRRSKSWFSLLTLGIIAGGLIVNATRGVWVGVAVAAFFTLRNALAVIMALIPVAGVGGWLTYMVLRTTPFMKRLADPNDLYSRLEIWKVAIRMFQAHPFVGVGHSEFTNVVSDYLQTQSNLGHFDIGRVLVADNIFFTTLAEHGIFGVISLTGMLTYAFLLLRRSKEKLYRAQQPSRAAFVECCELALIIYIFTGLFADVHMFTKATRLMFIIIGLGIAAGTRCDPVSANKPKLLESDTYSGQKLLEA